MKTEIIQENPRVCATVVQDNGYIQNECAHAFRSLIIRGRIELMTEENDKRKAIDVMLDHLEEKPDTMRTKLRDRKESYRDVQIWRLAIEEISGKEGK